MSKIPNKKHTDRELADLRAKSAMTAQGETLAPVYDKKIASLAVIAIGYILALGAPIWLVLRKLAAPQSYSMTDVNVMLACIVLSIIVALFIIFTRSLSRHHGSFIIIIALICSFTLVHVVNTDRTVYREMMAIFGKEIPAEKEPEFDNENSPGMQELNKQIERIELESKKP